MFSENGIQSGIELARSTAHGIAQGGFAEISGGDFGDGFMAAFSGSIAGSMIAARSGSGSFFGSMDQAGKYFVRRTIASSVVSGTVTEIGGGKFANGAMTGAMVHLLNAEHNAFSKSTAARNHGVSKLYDVGGGSDMYSEIQVDLTFAPGTDLESVANEIYDGLKVFRYFNESEDYAVLVGDGAAVFYSRNLPTPASVWLTNYDHARVVVADTGGLHFLVGTRNFRVFQSGSSQLTLATSAVDHFNGFVNRAAGQMMGFRSGNQHEIRTEYLGNVASRSGGRAGKIRIHERAIE